MNLLKVVENGLKKDELSEMKKALLRKRGELQKQIHNREADIKMMKDSDIIDLPVIRQEAEENLNKVLTDVNTDYNDLLTAWLKHEQANSAETLKNPRVDELEAELIPLKALLKQFPSEEEIQGLKLPKKKTK